MLSKSEKLNNNFDLIRLLAAFQVVLFHSVKYLDIRFESFGTAVLSVIELFPGVPIFFAISGYLISMSYNKNNNLKNYYKNRIIRIYPALWVCLLFGLLSVTLMNGWEKTTFDLKSFFIWIFAQLTFFQSYNSMYMIDYGVGTFNASLWTIPIELQFYILVPPIIYILNKFKKNFQNIILIISFILLWYVSYSFYDLRSIHKDNTILRVLGLTILPHFHMFLLGVFFQLNISKIKRYLENKFIFWLILYIGIALLFKIGTNFSVAGNHPFFVTYVFLCLCVFSLAYSYKSFSHIVLKRNDISYGVYIYHMIFINMFIEIGLVGSSLHIVYITIISVVISILSWKFVEKPCLKLKKDPLRKIS